MNFKLILFVFAFLFSFSIFAQYSGDVVYFKNGSFVKGEIIENMVDNYVKIKTVEGEIKVFQYSEIKEIKTNFTPGINEHTMFKDPNKGFYTIFDLGITLATGNQEYYSGVGVGINLVNGFHISEKIAAGIGIGVEGMTEPLLPIFAEGKYTLKQKKFSPEFRLQAGYSYAMDRYYMGQNKGGFLFSPLLGFRNYAIKSGFVFYIGYRFQNLYLKYTDWQGIETKQIKVFNRLTFRLGFVF